MAQNRLQEIETNLRSKRIDQRKAALDQLATVDSQEAVPILKKLATEQDFGLRCLAMMGFSNHLTDTSFEYLKQVLQEEEDHSVLAEAANSIYDFGAKAIAPLENLYDRSQNWLVRHTVIAVLSEINEPQTLFKTSQRAIDSRFPLTKEIGLKGLQKLLQTSLKSATWQLFAKLAVDSDWQIRLQTAIALRDVSDQEAKEILGQLKKDENYRVVAAALEQNE